MTLFPLSEQLKQATSPYHRELDQLPVLKNLMSPSLTGAQYETAMLYFHHCFSAWQPALTAAYQLKPPAFALIDNQIAALRMEISRFNVTLTPELPVPQPIITSVETYLGYSYVLTGAQLGARFILRKLQKSALALDYDFNYYVNLSQNTIDINEWKANLDQLIAQGHFEQQAIIDAAITCFSQLIYWFAQTPKISSNNAALIQR